MGTIVASFAMPHPPVIIPDIGNGRERQAFSTTNAMKIAAERIYSYKPDTIIVISPHSPIFSDYIYIPMQDKLSGDLQRFGFSEELHFKNNSGLAQRIIDLAKSVNIACGDLEAGLLKRYGFTKRLDHGVLVPLYFIKEAYSVLHEPYSIKKTHVDLQESDIKKNAYSESHKSDNIEKTYGNLQESDIKKNAYSESHKSDNIEKTYENYSEATGFKLITISLAGFSNIDMYRFGGVINKAVRQSDNNVVLIASGDLSHKLSKDAPYGYDPSGMVFDDIVCKSFANADPVPLLNMNGDFCEKAGECGHRAFLIMFGAMNRKKVSSELLSYEGPFGVGYAVAEFLHSDSPSPETIDGKSEGVDFLELYEANLKKEMENRRNYEDAYVKLARLTLEAYVSGKPISSVSDAESIIGSLPKQMLSARAGVFVSIKKDGILRGCIGTTASTTGSIAEEIIRNAVCAGTEDPRFPPVTENELMALVYSVDILKEPETINDDLAEELLDVKKYGVIVSNGNRKGLLLPNLEGVDTVSQQIDIAKRKAGIKSAEKVRIQRFEVIRHK